MSKQRLTCVIIIGCTMAVFLTKTSARVRVPLTGPDPKSLRGLTDAEIHSAASGFARWPQPKRSRDFSITKYRSILWILKIKERMLR